MSKAPVPTETTRWRCAQCGNLTRFDVTRSSRVVEYVHLDLAGEPHVEERTVLDERVEQVRCRWCDGVGTVELVRRSDAGPSAEPPAKSAAESAAESADGAAPPAGEPG